MKNDIKLNHASRRESSAILSPFDEIIRHPPNAYLRAEMNLRLRRAIVRLRYRGVNKFWLSSARWPLM
jgi:hypothetical protein